MPMIELLYHFSPCLRDYVQNFLIEKHFGSSEFLTGGPDLPISDLTSPRVKIRSDLKIFEFLANRQAGFLENILGIAPGRHKRMNIGKNPPLISHHKLNQLG